MSDAQVSADLTRIANALEAANEQQAESLLLERKAVEQAAEMLRLMGEQTAIARQQHELMVGAAVKPTPPPPGGYA